MPIMTRRSCRRPVTSRRPVRYRAEAGYEDGLCSSLSTSGYRQPAIDLAAVLKEQWSELALTSKLAWSRKASTMAMTVGGGRSGNYRLGIATLSTILPGCDASHDAIWNESHFSDAEFDALALHGSRSTLDEAERIQAYSDIRSGCLPTAGRSLFLLLCPV